MDHKLIQWRKSKKHLPLILKKYNDQADIFNTMHQLVELPDNITISPTEGREYVIDVFLWFMARHGYTLQKSKARQKFENIGHNVIAMKHKRAEKLLSILTKKK